MTRTADMLRWLAFVVIASGALLRLLTTTSRLPWWDLDPVTGFVPETTMTPALSLTVDALVLVAAGLGVIGEALAGRAVMWKSGLLVIAGCIGVYLHGVWFVPVTGEGADLVVRGDFRSLVIGSSWAGAMVGAWAMAHLARDEALRRVGIGVLLGVVGMLAARGAYQVMVEQPRQVASFEADPARFLERQGIEPGSAHARMLERKLRKPDATGWFGLANVYASIVGACAVGWIAMLLGAGAQLRRRLVGWLVVAGIALPAIAGLAALALSRSRGGVMAAAIGLACTLGVWWSARVRRLGPAITLGFPALVLVAIAARGLIGDAVGELSLLLRWQYLRGAVRVIAENPFAGVGPGPFKQAYLLNRLPTSPEEIDSAHSVLVDWIAMLGLFGAAWIGVWLWWMARVGRNVLHAEHRNHPFEAPEPRLVRIGLAVVLLVFVSSAIIEQPALTPEAVVVRLVGLAIWAGALGSMLSLSRISPALVVFAAFGAALSLAVHAQMDVTGYLPSSAPWMMALIGVAAAPVDAAGAAHPSTEREALLALPAGTARRSTLGVMLAGALCLGGIAMGGVLTPRVWAWQGLLQRAALPLADGADGPEVARAASMLERAHAFLPSAPGPALEAGRVYAVLGASLKAGGAGDRAEKAWARGREVLERVVESRPGSSRVWSRMAAYDELRARVTGEARFWRAAEEAWERSAELDPHGISPAIRGWRAAVEAGNDAGAREWALRVLRIDRGLELDPLRRLSPELRGRVEASAGLEPGGEAEENAGGP